MLCSDRRLDQGEWGADDAATKVSSLGYNWSALLAGHWPSVKELALAIRNAVRAGTRPTDRAEIFGRIESVSSSFASSVLCKKPSELIVTGSIGTDPMMIHVDVQPKKKAKLEIAPDFIAIGEGAYAASLMLKYRLYNEMRSIPEACYFAYEAKHFSEKVSSVGSGTVLTVHAPLASDDPTRLAAVYVNETGFRHLDSLLTRHSIQPAMGLIEPFPDSFFS